MTITSATYTNSSGETVGIWQDDNSPRTIHVCCWASYSSPDGGGGDEVRWHLEFKWTDETGALREYNRWKPQ